MIAGAGSAAKVLSAIATLHEPLTPTAPAFSWEIIGAAIIDYESKPRGEFSIKLLRAICSDLANPKSATSRGKASIAGPAFAPGHSNLPPTRFCEHCEGELATPEGQKRPIRVHAEGCPSRRTTQTAKARAS